MTTMPRIDPEFGLAVKALLERRRLSIRQARMDTGINHATLHEMTHGIVPGTPQTVVAFARGLDEDPNEWLARAGYPFRVAEETGAETLFRGLRDLERQHGAPLHISFMELPPTLTPDQARDMLTAIATSLGIETP